MLEKIAKQKPEHLLRSFELEKRKVHQDLEYANSAIYLKPLEPTQENLLVQSSESKNS